MVEHRNHWHMVHMHIARIRQGRLGITAKARNGKSSNKGKQAVAAVIGTPTILLGNTSKSFSCSRKAASFISTGRWVDIHSRYRAISASCGLCKSLDALQYDSTARSTAHQPNHPTFPSGRILTISFQLDENLTQHKLPPEHQFTVCRRDSCFRAPRRRL